MALIKLDDAALIFNSDADKKEKLSRIPVVVKELCAHRDPFNSAHLTVEFLLKIKNDEIVEAIKIELKAQSDRPKCRSGRFSES
tara:strand:- start:430 stop:681 length:252 start_codon:yes stop_codon:yes gene_type:complete